MLRNNKTQSTGTGMATFCMLPPLVVCVVMVLYIIAEKMLKGNYITNDNPYVAVVIAQICVFLLPCAFVIAIGTLFRRASTAEYKLCSLHSKTWGFVLSCIPTLIFGSMLIKYLSYLYLGSSTSSSISISGSNDFLYVFMSSVFLPAICEEILIRGIVFTEYEKKLGAFAAILGSSILFALLHFDNENFLSYLYAGLILGIAVHTTNSIIAPIILHFSNNFICIYSDTFLQRISKESISTFLVLFILGTLLLISLFIFFEALEWLCTYKSDKLTSHSDSLPFVVSRLLPANERVRKVIAKVLFSPMFICAILLHILIARYI